MGTGDWSARGVPKVSRSDSRPLIAGTETMSIVSVSDVENDELSYEAEYGRDFLLGFTPNGDDVDVSFSPAIAGYRLSLALLRSLCDEVEIRIKEARSRPAWKAEDG